MEHLGYLQLDPTNVVERSHVLVLWSRHGRFDRADLDRLMWRDRSVYETVSYIFPTPDRPLHQLRVHQTRRGEGPNAVRINSWMKQNDRLRREVLGRLRKDGPLPITAFEDRATHSWTSSGWNDDRNVSQMLAFLMRIGRVAVGGRAGGKRVWVLANSWLPPVKPWTPRAAAGEAVERALRSLGVATYQEMRRHRAFGRFVTPAAVQSREREGIIRRVWIEGLRGPHFVRVGDLPRTGHSRRTTFLSPFDNLIIDRERAEALFGFRYRMEIYVPRHLRRRGFWAMPILHRDRLVGTIDPKMDREHDRLDVLSLQLERDAPRDHATKRAIAEAVEDLAGFAGAREVRWPKGSASSYSRR